MIYIINSSVLTTFGTFEYKESSLEEIKYILNNNAFISVIGHQETASLLSKKLGLSISLNRIEIKQTEDDVLIVIKSKARLYTNKFYSETELEEIGYDIGIIRKIK